MKKKRNWLILLALTLLLGRMAFLFQPLLPDEPVSGKAVSQTVSEAVPTFTPDPRIAEARSLWNAIEDRIQTSETGEITLDVDYLSQEGILPTGCETVSAAMVLNYWQQEILPTDLAEQLPSENIRWDESGKCYGPDPNEVFVGSPFTTWGYGCFAPVIEELIHETAPLLEAETLYDQTLEQLYTDYVCRGVPVLIWCTICQLKTSPGTVWELPSGETFTWPNNEHCMVLVGEQNGRWVCMDPYNGNGRITVDKDLLADRYDSMGSQAVVTIPGGFFP